MKALFALAKTIAPLITSTREAIHYSITNITRLPGQATFQIASNVMSDNILNVTRKGCEPVYANCTNYDDKQHFETSCGNFTVQCGPQVVETTFDPLKLMPSVSFEGFSELIGSNIDSAYQLAQEKMQDMGAWFNSFMPNTLCDWDDLQCHFDALQEPLSECNQLGYQDAFMCQYNTVANYLQNYDFNEIYHELLERYTPDEHQAIAAISIGATLTTAALVTYYFHKKCSHDNAKVNDLKRTKDSEPKEPQAAAAPAI